MGSSVGVSKVHDECRARRRDRARARVRRVGRRRGDGARPRDRGRGARRRSARKRRCPARSSRPPTSTTTPTSTRTARPSSSRPAPLDDAEIAAARDLARRAFEACRVEAMARVDFFYTDARLRVERAQHDPGLHTDLDVPAAVGGVRPALRRAPRPAHRARALPPRPPRPPRRPPALSSDASRRPSTGVDSNTAVMAVSLS